MNSLTDEEIMLDVKNGNTELLSFLYRRHQKHLFNFFMQIGTEYHQSEDFVQQVFFRILRYRNSYKEGAMFRKWMFTIARNLVKRDYEKQKHQKSIQLPQRLITEAPDDTDAGEKEEKIKELYKALESLQASDRELISLSRFQGMKYEAISEITGISVGAIKVRMHRALKKLREHYFENA
ncbi:RNA polymerase sigma factor [Marinilabilia rubra]|uniref:RNA polymerase sigma factor n=1 Tax=Marinilabilia rubra TaxID=2162893 RepID=A0A2U2BDA1_9BACT|nr:sigma-70 family RNA polymerase sigma factor [Marinilabilia rubra]PWE01013.1 RNA polymerase sigma factor [Marinilabilia rubra]